VRAREHILYVIYGSYVGNIFWKSCARTKAGDWRKCDRKSLELDKVNDLKDGLKRRFDEIIQTMNSRDSLLEVFDEEIFNALVEKIEILTPTHFIFELKSGMRVEEIGT